MAAEDACGEASDRCGGGTDMLIAAIIMHAPD